MFHVGSCKVIVLKVLGSKADGTRREQVREGHWIGPVVSIGPRIMAVGVGPCSGPVVGPDRIELVLDMIIQRSECVLVLPLGADGGGELSSMAMDADFLI
ncbi:hypothetical protein Tco_1299025 [Tanacetum coccineum]